MKLEEHPFIASIAEERRAHLAKEIEVSDLEDGAVIFSEKTEPDALYLILSGKVVFTKRRWDETLKIVSESEEGSFFGEVGIFTKELRALNASASGPCRIGRVPKAAVEKIIEDAEPVRKILGNVIEHLKSTTDHYMDDVMHTEKMALVGTMISSVLHDFKNPFSIISLGATIIRQQYEDDPKTVRICANIESQIQRMVHMANDLSAFARGDSKVEIVDIELKELFLMFRELNVPFFKDENVELTMESNGASIACDHSKILRALQNLVSNSIEAIHHAGIKGRIEIVAWEDDGGVFLTVADNGRGIPEEIQSTFFEPFVTHGKSDGTGLGTAIVKSIIEAHEGEIRFETSAEGTVFTIYLPSK